MRDAGDDTAAGRAVDEVHLRGVGGDRQVINADRARDSGVLPEVEDRGSERRDAGDVLVARDARGERDLDRERAVVPGLRSRVPALGVGEQVAEAAGHAGGGARGGGEPQLEVTLIDGAGGPGVQADADLNALRRNDALVIADHELLRVLLAQADLGRAGQGGLLDEGEERRVAVGEHPPRRALARCPEVPVRVPESGIRHQLPYGDECPQAVPLAELLVEVRPAR